MSSPHPSPDSPAPPPPQLRQLDALIYMFLPLTLILISTYHLTSLIHIHIQLPPSLRTRPSPSPAPSPRTRKLTPPERLLTCWFTLNLLLHTLFEGFFLLHAPYGTLSSTPHLLGQLWREYARCDTRYLLGPGDARFAFLWAVEGVTVGVVAPLCAVAVYGLVTRGLGRGGRGGRGGGGGGTGGAGAGAGGVVRTVVAAAHLWGCAMYFLTGWMERERERWGGDGGEGSGLFWGYWVGMNAPWIVVPVGILVGEANGWWGWGGGLERWETTSLEKSEEREGEREGGDIASGEGEGRVSVANSSGSAPLQVVNSSVPTARRVGAGGRLKI